MLHSTTLLRYYDKNNLLKVKVTEARNCHKMNDFCQYLSKFLHIFCDFVCIFNLYIGERTGLVVRASDSRSGDPGSILGRVGVLFP